MRWVRIAVCAVVENVMAQMVPEIYGWSCIKIADRQDWGVPSGLSKKARSSYLCQIPEYVEFTWACTLQAVANSSDPEAAFKDALSKSLCPQIPLNTSTTVSGTHKKVITIDVAAPEVAQVDPTNMAELYAALETARWRYRSDELSRLYGIALVIYWVGILILELLVRFCCTWGARHSSKLAQCRVSRWIRAKIFFAPMVTHHHSEMVSMPWPQCLYNRLIFHLPTRMLTLALLGFAVLNYTLLFTSFPSPTPYNFMFESTSLQNHKAMAIRGAYFTVWKLPLLALFACRNNVFLFFHPWRLDTFNVMHKWIARMTIIDSIVHSIAISLVKVEQGWYEIVWHVPYWQWGVVGTLCASFIAVQSMHWVSQWKYELFLVMHIVLAIVFIISTWYHVRDLPYGRVHVLLTVAIWGSDHLGRFIRLLLAGRVTAQLKHYPTVSVFKFNPPWDMSHVECGSYTFVHLAIGPFGLHAWQSHPFTFITEAPGATLSDHSDISKEPKELLICVRHKHGATQCIKQLAEGPIHLALDGPYGRAMPLASFESVVMIAGGIGITAPLSYMPGLIAANKLGKCRKVVLHWAVSNLDNVEWALNHIRALERDQVRVQIYVNGLSPEYDIPTSLKGVIQASRLDCAECVKQTAQDFNGSLAIFACGPDKMNDDIRQATCEAILASPHYIEYFEESFHW